MLFCRDTCGYFVPDIVIASGMLDMDQILTGMMQCLRSLDSNIVNPIDCKIDVIDIIRRWPMFGASFYHVKVRPRLLSQPTLKWNIFRIHYILGYYCQQSDKLCSCVFWYLHERYNRYNALVLYLFTNVLFLFDTLVWRWTEDRWELSSRYKSSWNSLSTQ